MVLTENPIAWMAMLEGGIWCYCDQRKMMQLTLTLNENDALLNQEKCGVHRGKHSVLNK